MYTEMKKAVTAADEKAQYDESAKRLLAQKYVLAHILVKCMDEFQGMKPEAVVPYIEGDPVIGMVPIDPGLTNKEKTDESGQRIVGLNTENSEIQEGLIRFDILFYVRLKDGLSKIIINVEAQKREPTDYKILNRAIFYVSRLVSSQKERDFVNSNYNDIKRVFSIWICMNMDDNSMSFIHLTKENYLGNHDWSGDLDLLNIVLLGITNDIPEQDEKYELHRLLSALLSNKLKVEDRLEIIEKEYQIPLTEKERKDVNLMCNLGEGIEEVATARGMAKGMAKGMAQGMARGMAEGINKGISQMIVNMYKKGYSLKQIAEVAEMPMLDVEKIIKENSATSIK